MKISLFIISFFILLPMSSWSANFLTTSCTIDGEWNKFSEGKYQIDIPFQPLLLEKSISPESSEHFQKYLNTFKNYNIHDPFERLKKAETLVRMNTYISPGELKGILLTIDAILKGKVGKIRAASCLEWALFSAGAKHHGFDLSFPVYLETSWSLWRKGETVRIIMELGITNKVTSDFQYFKELFNNGWTQIGDLHNHPAMHEHPKFKIEDLGPNLFPSNGDTKYWQQTYNWKNNFVGITDGIQTLELTPSEVEYLGIQYYCAKYPESYNCKNPNVF